MFFIPLTQVESVELVIHALRAAAGEADCSACPARQVCMKQCLSIAETVSRMVEEGTLPVIEAGPDSPETAARETAPTEDQPAPETSSGKGHLKVIK